MKRIAAAIGLLFASSQPAIAGNFIFDYIQPSFPFTEAEGSGGQTVDGEGGYGFTLSKSLSFFSDEFFLFKNGLVQIRYAKQRFGDIATDGLTVESDLASLRLGYQFEWGEVIRPFIYLGGESANLREEGIGLPDLDGYGFSVTGGAKADFFEEGFFGPFELEASISLIEIDDLSITDARFDIVYWMDANIGLYAGYNFSDFTTDAPGFDDLFEVTGVSVGIRASLLSDF